MKLTSIFLWLGLLSGILSGSPIAAQQTGPKTNKPTTTKPSTIPSKPDIAYSGPVVGDPVTNQSYQKPKLDFVATATSDNLCKDKDCHSILRKGAYPVRLFSIKNIGTEPLIIISAKGSCGCVTIAYPQEPIMPGATAKLEIRYDTNRIGTFMKTVTLKTNSNHPELTIQLTGEVAECAPKCQPKPDHE